MNTVKITLLNAVDRYFNHLSNFGAIGRNNKEAILITLFIHLILEGPMSYYVTNNDYRIMENLLYCLNGSSCLINYSKYCNNKSILSFINMDDDPIKILELYNYLRITGDSEPRFHIL